MIGKRLSPVLVEIEDALFDFEVEHESKPEYTQEGFRASSKIFMSALMDKMWELQQKEKIPIEQRLEMVNKAGQELRQFIKTYTGLDSHEFYKI